MAVGGGEEKGGRDLGYQHRRDRRGLELNPWKFYCFQMRANFYKVAIYGLCNFQSNSIIKALFHNIFIISANKVMINSDFKGASYFLSGESILIISHRPFCVKRTNCVMCYTQAIKAPQIIQCVKTAFTSLLEITQLQKKCKKYHCKLS